MTDRIAAQFAARQVEAELATLRSDAARVAEDARLYAERVKSGGPAPGDANRLVQGAIQLAQLAARVGGIRETVAYLAPTTEETPR